MKTNPYSLHEKTIVISGASSGIGKKCAQTFAEAGAQLVLLGRDMEKLKNLHTHLGDDSKHAYYSLDLLKTEEIKPLIASIAATHGKISGLVHSAGIESTIPLNVLQNDHLHMHFSVNVNAGFILAKEISRAKNKAENLSLVFIASVMGLLGEVGKIAYSSSKGALVNGVKSMALELAQKGIRANTISPAMVQTQMAQQLFSKLSEENKAEILQKHPLGIGHPEDVAWAAQYLLSDASKWVSGSNLVVDGGYSAQ